MKTRVACKLLLNLGLVSLLPTVAAGCSDDLSGAVTAAAVVYDASGSGLSGATVQAAIDELAARPDETVDEARFESIEDAVVSLGEQVQGQAAALAALATRVTSIEETPPLTTLDAIAVKYDGSGQATNVRDALDALRETLDEQAARIATLEANAVTRQATVDENTGVLATLATRIAALEGVPVATLTDLDHLGTDLSAKIASPKPCPDDMLASTGVTCMETTTRPVDGLLGASFGCSKAGRRLCTAEEIFVGCGGTDASVLGFPGNDPEWTSSVAGVHPHSSDLLEMAYLVISKFGNSCDVAVIASGNYIPDGAETNDFAYRCCTSR